ncbi:Sodium-dependent phosphate transport protein [Trinorchestia longiramus]|nr:Sodium-dependent phosphate transport protein [Trinorchestia longiramus]
MKSYDLNGQNGLANPVFVEDVHTEVPLPKDVKALESEDHWHVDTGKAWSEMTGGEKVARVVLNISKVLMVFVLLYFFICSLDLLSSSFRLISGKSTSSLLGGEYMRNPVVGLMVGILLTVLVQSSSTSTSIVVSMVSAGMLNVHESIPIIMGTNIGTSVTNTIVSLTQVGDREQFRLAFAGATVHDMFNWLSVIVMLILELSFGLLEKLTGAIVESVALGSGSDIKILKVVTEPFTDLIIELDSVVLKCWGLGEWLEKDTMIKQFCESYTNSSLEVNLQNVVNSTVSSGSGFCIEDPTEVGVEHSCHFLFYGTALTDSQVGIILLVASLIILCSALIIIVKLLNSMLKGSIALVIKKTLNADIPYVPWLTGYIALAIGAVMTFIVQSSSIFTSTLTPLIGIGIITVERAYPLTLGSNIGTTTTALLASLAGEGEGLANAVQIALVHLFFNIFGILIFYPIPFMRFPIPMCKALGKITAQYRWFAVVYLIFMFFLMPAMIFVLSLGGTIVLWSVLGPIVIVLLAVVIINVIQSKRSQVLPGVLQNWDFLPKPLRSLDPYDRVLTALPCCKSCQAVAPPDVESIRTQSESTNSVGCFDNKNFSY